MKLNSIRWRLAFSYAAIALLAAFSLGLVLRAVLSTYYARQETQYLRSRALQIGFIAAQLLDSKIPEPVIQDQSHSWSFILQARVRIEDASGKVIADSGVPDLQKTTFVTNAQAVPMSFGTPVVSGSAAGGGHTFQYQIVQSSGPFVQNEQKDILFINQNSVQVSVPGDVTMYGLFDASPGSPLRRSTQSVQQTVVNDQGVVLGRVILSDGPAYGDEILNSVTKGWIFASLSAVIVAALAGWLLSNRITTPLTELAKVTAQMSQGNLGARADVRSTDEIGALGHSFNEMASQVEEMVGTLRSFVADAAHELHTPLTALQANLELARDETLASGASADETASARTRYLSRAQEQGQRLEALVRSLLDLSRIEAADADAKSGFASVDFIQLVREAGEQFASRAEQADRSFTLNIQDEAMNVPGNEMQLKQVVGNLLQNALKFTPVNGTIALHLTLEPDSPLVNLREHTLSGTRAPAFQDRGGLTLTVSDSGIGIPPEDSVHLFERFHRGRNASEFSGNGLGLAIVKAIVEAHGGEVTAYSAGSGEGSVFTVKLPVN